MSTNQTAIAVVAACESAGVPYMITGAFAYNYYGIPRSTMDFDLVLDVSGPDVVQRVIDLIGDQVEFGDQVQFDTLTWGKRHIGRSKQNPGFVVELFELFDDSFVQQQFQRRKQLHSAQLNRIAWLPTAEDVIVQKLRWGRTKDLDDARDVLAVQGPETLDMPYIKRWCSIHGTSVRLTDILEDLPPL